MKRKRFLLSGEVQGVGFRWYVRAIARERHLPGWVRNNPDGTVEIVVEGSPEEITGFIGAIRAGSLGRNVGDIQQTEESVVGESSFDIRYA